MGKKLLKQAKKMGLTNLPKYTFYCQPAGLKRKFSTATVKFAYTITDWLASFDPSTERNDGGSGRTVFSNIIATQSKAFVEITTRMAGFSGWDLENFVCQVNIYTENVDIVKNIVKILDNQWEDGMLAHTNFQKIEKKWKVGKEDVIKAINSFLE